MTLPLRRLSLPLVTGVGLVVVPPHHAAIGAPAVFIDVTDDVGIDAYQIGAGYPQEGLMMGGMAAADFNRDGWMDLYVIRGGDLADILYLNDGAGRFIDATASWGLGERLYSSGVTVGDIDDDGWIDMYVTTHGAPGIGVAPGRHCLFRNTGSGFVEMAHEAGVQRTSPVVADGFGACFGDYDLDGDLDLAVAGWRGQSSGNRLFRNDGTGRFTDVTAGAIQHNMLPVRGFTPRFCDMDADGFPELLWVADFETSRYLRNNRDGTFTEMTALAGAGLDQNGMGTTIADLDGDGDMDWYVTSIHGAGGLKTGNKLYLNQGGHGFVEAAAARGCDDGGWGWGVEAVDVDHDGDLDLAEANGWVYGEWIGENARLWINDGHANFTEAAVSSGLTHPGNTRGLIRVDVDRDGDQDLVLGGYHEAVRVFRNELDLAAPETRWLRVRLETTGHDDLAPEGIGAVVRVEAGGRAQVRAMQCATTYLSTSETTVHFGLGEAAMVDRLVVEWPNGRVNLWRGVASDQSLSLEPLFVEGDADGDAEVGATDLNLSLSRWGESVRAWREGDVTGDGMVDFRDLETVLAGWGNSGRG